MNLKPLTSCLFIILAALASGQSAESAALCMEDCIVRIGGIEPSYVPGSRVKFSIENVSTGSVVVTIALEGFFSGNWYEVVVSVLDLQHPLAKTVKGKRLKSKGVANLSFDPEAALAARARVDHRSPPPTSLRLRINVYDESKRVQTVVSQAFRLADAAQPKSATIVEKSPLH